ncbi:MAG: helix-hairpin-helix domain-containing protein [Oscillospiraceae bacterium]|jgi:comEA protein|nr:helix-hairpin-helix domain-containing protein [Oscillospiraceae bacterium]
MNSQEKQMRVLIAVSLILCSVIIFYNAFFIPEVATPAVVYIDKEKNSELQDYEPETSKRLNINSATEEELAEGISGIGPTLAKRIVEYRANNGLFKDVSELQNVAGIGEKNFEKIKDFVYVGK